MLSAFLLMMTPAPLIVQDQFSILPRDKGIVNDAEKRWSMKSGEGSRSMEYRFPIVVDIIDERCVILKLQAPAIGETPVYCYDIQSDNLRRFKDDVE